MKENCARCCYYSKFDNTCRNKCITTEISKELKLVTEKIVQKFQISNNSYLQDSLNFYIIPTMKNSKCLFFKSNY